MNTLTVTFDPKDVASMRQAIMFMCKCSGMTPEYLCGIEQPVPASSKADADFVDGVLELLFKRAGL